MVSGENCTGPPSGPSSRDAGLLGQGEAWRYATPCDICRPGAGPPKEALRVALANGLSLGGARPSLGVVDPWGAREASGAAWLAAGAGLWLGGVGIDAADSLLCAGLASRCLKIWLLIDAVDWQLSARGHRRFAAPDAVRLARRDGATLVGLSCPHHRGFAGANEQRFGAWSRPLEEPFLRCNGLVS